MLWPARELRNYLLSVIDNSSLADDQRRINIGYYELVARLRDSKRHSRPLRAIRRGDGEEG